MHVLMTSDTVGGVWTYTRDLVTGLLHSDHRVTLVSLGRMPSPDQHAWADSLAATYSAFAFHPTAWKLEWMPDCADDLCASASFLADLIAELAPDILHSNQFHYGSLPVRIPKVVVAHSDVVSWWHAVHNGPPPHPDWRHYIECVTRGLAGATAVVCPTQWMKQQIINHYAPPHEPIVIRNGRSAAHFCPNRPKTMQAVTAGRRWDKGKNIALLDRVQSWIPILVAGECSEPRAESDSTSPQPASSALPANDIRYLGNQTEQQMRELLETSALYIATSQYEPFGLAPLEAALAGCAIIANDIPSLREVWGDAAFYCETNSSESLGSLLEKLAGAPHLVEFAARQAYHHTAQHLSSFAMCEAYVQLYRDLARAGGNSR